MINKTIKRFKIIWRLFQGRQKTFVFIMALILMSGFAEMFSVGMALPVLESTFNTDPSAPQSRITKLLSFIPQENFALIVIIALVVFAILSVVFKVATVYFSQKAIQAIALNWRVTLYEKYVYSLYSFVLRFKQGDIIHNISVETQAAGNMIFQIVQWTTYLLISVSIYLLLLFSDFYTTMFLTVIIAAILFFVNYLGKKYQLKLSKRIIKFNQALNSIVSESILSLQQMKIFSLEKRFTGDLFDAGEKRNNAFVKRATIQQLPQHISFMIMPIVLLSFYVYFEYISNQKFVDFIPTLGFVFVGFTRISASLMNVVNQRMAIYNALPSLQLIENILAQKIDREKLEEGKAFEKLDSDIEFKNIDFSYLSDRKILENFNLTMPKGKMTALIGPSGSGKSTLSYLLVRLYNPQSGEIQVNGEDLKDYSLESWRKKIGYVTQDTYIFNMSIRENIKIGKPDATEEEIEEAAQAAHCLEFIEKLPEKWDTIVGERGMKLSGGQRQRVAIARAMIRKPELYIFDEATSSLDNHSEKLIQQSIENISKTSTMLVIAHRLTTIENADVVYDLGALDSEKFMTVK